VKNSELQIVSLSGKVMTSGSRHENVQDNILQASNTTEEQQEKA
jgi:hypothetical protein